MNQTHPRCHQRRVLTGIDLAGQSKRDALQGAWQTVEVTVTGPEARTISIPEPRPNLIVFTGQTLQPG